MMRYLMSKGEILIEEKAMNKKIPRLNLINFYPNANIFHLCVQFESSLGIIRIK